MTSMDTFTLASLEQSATLRDEEHLECEVYSPLFGENVKVDIIFDEEGKTVSRRQLKALNQFIAIRNGIEHIKSELFAHWDNNSDIFDFVCEDANHAFDNASLMRLLINREQYWGNLPCSMLRFRVEWDPEHGAGIFIVDGQLSHFGDSFDWPVVDT